MLGIKFQFWKIAFTMDSIFCLFAAPAAFTPAGPAAMLMMCACGLVARRGRDLVFSVVNLGILSTAVMTCAFSFGYLVDIKVFILPALTFVIGYGGAVMGIGRLQKVVDSNLS